MSTGLQTYNKEGKLTFDSSWGVSRILGTFDIEVKTGSKKIVSEDGTPVNSVFAFFLSLL